MILIARYSIAEAVRRRVFTIIVILTAAFLTLYALGAFAIFNEFEDQGFAGGELIEERAVTGGTLTGLGMFVTFFLGVVLAVFMTMSTVRGDAERGVLQPLVVRPLGRDTVLLGRLAAATAVAAAYVAIVFAAIVLIIWLAGDWTPDRLLTPGLGLMAAVAIITCLSVLGSVHLPTSANGIAIFMIFGAGLTAGLLNQIGEAIDSDRLEQISDVAAIVLPFEALYQGGLDQLTADTRGFTEVAINLGPFGGAESVGLGTILWATVYAGAAVFAALRGFARRDI
jgi:ABC-type transport system involved in multi-copper enzyme maturation permease subunit